VHAHFASLLFLIAMITPYCWLWFWLAHMKEFGMMNSELCFPGFRLWHCLDRLSACPPNIKTQKKELPQSLPLQMWD